MFDINSQYRIDTAIPVITANYKVLHFDEFPILFSGTNKYNNKLLGSLSYENFENDSFRYFVILVDDRQYYEFHNRRLSYKDLIEENKELFILDKDVNDNILDIFHVPVEAIPSDFLPLHNSFIPESHVLSNGLNFSFSLKGKLADLHKALVNDINSVNNRIYDYLEEGIDLFRSLSVSPKIYSNPSQVGSYKLNFDIELERAGQVKLFQVDYNQIGYFINQYLQYITHVLPNEEDGFLKNSPESSRGFNMLMNNLVNVYKSGGFHPPSTLKDLLIDNINESATKLSDITEYIRISESFDSIEIGSQLNDGSISAIGYIDQSYKSSVSSKLLPSEVLTEDERDIITDETAKSYRVLVFRLNRDTGKGGARLYFEDEKYHTVRLNIDKGDKELSNSVFTKSLDEDKVVDVTGIATRENGVFKKLECYL